MHDTYYHDHVQVDPSDRVDYTVQSVLLIQGTSVKLGQASQASTSVFCMYTEITFRIYEVSGWAR